VVQEKVASKFSNVFAHRGFWSESLEKNSLLSFKRASDHGFSIETDIRDGLDGIVVSHDAFNAHADIQFGQITDFESSFALNLKSDGIGLELEKHIEWIERTSSFVFDGSVPEMLMYRGMGIPLALRLSEYESKLSWPPEYIWLDSFHQDWWLEDAFVLNKIFETPTIIVSPEIHNRSPYRVWDKIGQLITSGCENLSVCTDKPLEYLQWLK
jgi:hypothetical protein